MALEIINETGMEMGYIAGRIPFPGHSLTIIVKGLFDLNHGGAVSLAAEQLYPTGDELYEDDSDELGGPRYPSDFAYEKPAADLMLVGSCHAPKDEETCEQHITFAVGGFSKTLKIIGDKYWDSKLLDQGDNISQPFTSIELRYDNAFGGDGYTDNPVGKGYQEQDSGEGGVRKLFPNILHEHENDHSFLSSFSPTGFGPVADSWPLRQGHIGSYKGKYLKTRWPWYAENFDYHYFNAAPPDQQLAGYLVGDEELLFENIHPVERQYKTTLPGLRCRCFTTIEKDNSEPEFKEVSLNLDTLWVDMDSEQLVLVWRGWTDITDEDFPELSSIFLLTEALSEPKKSLPECQTLLAARLAEIAREDSPDPEEPPEDDIPEPEEVDEELEQAEKAMHARLIKSGIDPDNLPPQTPENIAKEKEFLKEIGMEDEDIEEEEKPTPETFMAAFANGQQFNDILLEDLDLSNQDLAGINFTDSILTNVNLSGANLEGATFQGATLINVNLQKAHLVQSILDDADLTGINLTEANLSKATLHGTTLEKATLTGATLSKAAGQYCFLAQADLNQAKLMDSDFSGADFSECHLQQADFSRAILVDASFEAVMAQGIIMDHANLTTFRASENSDFKHGSFLQVTGRESIWDGADLSSSDFSYCHLEEADFSKANLTEATLTAANMRMARFNGADLTKVQAQEMNLFAGSLKKAILNETDFSGANLYGVEFLDAEVETAIFDQTNLKKTKLA